VAAMQHGLPASFATRRLSMSGTEQSPGQRTIAQLIRAGCLHSRRVGFGVVFAPDVGKATCWPARWLPLAAAYILSEAYYTLTELAQAVYAELGVEKRPRPPSSAAAGMIASSGMDVQFTHQPP